MGSYCLGELIRGSENLESSRQRERIVTFCVVQKVTKKHAGLRPATSIQISARYEISAEMTGHHHVTGRAGHCELSGYRRWGFESVRKGSRTSDTRLRSFEKGMLYCKLTVGFRGWNLWLHVSLGAVRNRCRCALKKAFLYRLALHESKKQVFFAN